MADRVSGLDVDDCRKSWNTQPLVCDDCGDGGVIVYVFGFSSSMCLFILFYGGNIHKRVTVVSVVLIYFANKG